MLLPISYSRSDWEERYATALTVPVTRAETNRRRLAPSKRQVSPARRCGQSLGRRGRVASNAARSQRARRAAPSGQIRLRHTQLRGCRLRTHADTHTQACSSSLDEIRERGKGLRTRKRARRSSIAASRSAACASSKGKRAAATRREAALRSALNHVSDLCDARKQLRYLSDARPPWCCCWSHTVAAPK